MNAKQTTFYPSIPQGFGIFGLFILWSIIAAPLNMIPEKYINKSAITLISYTIACGGTLFTILQNRKKAGQQRPFSLKIENPRIIPFLIIGSIALIIGIVSPLADSIPMPESVQKMFVEYFGKKDFYSFLAIAIAAPIFEELIFRGVILDGFLKNYSPRKAIIMSSVLFGIVHLNPWQFITAFTIGVFSGWVYYYTRSLLPSILIHFSVNFTGFISIYFSDPQTSIKETFIESYGGITNALLVTSGAIIAAIACIYILNKELLKNLPTTNDDFPAEELPPTTETETPVQ